MSAGIKFTSAQLTKIILALVAVIGTITVAVIQFKPIPTPTPPPPGPTPTPCLVRNIGWKGYNNYSPQSKIEVGPVMGTDCVIQVSFDLVKDGWVSVYKKLDPNILSQSQGLRFTYTWTGAVNDLEFKLIEREPNGQETLFYVVWPQASLTKGKDVTLEVHYSDMVCNPDTPGTKCTTGKLPINLGIIDRIDFTFSNKPGGSPGSGTVIIKDIQLLP